MVQKRPYDEEEILKISFKHPRQVEVEHNKQLISFSESVFPEDAFEKPKTLGEPSCVFKAVNEFTVCSVHWFEHNSNLFDIVFPFTKNCTYFRTFCLNQ